MIPLRKSTSVVLPLGRFVDNVDGDTSETALSILNTDILLRKAGATSMVVKNSGGATHMSVGEYHATFDSTDTNTVGPLKIVVKVAGALGVEVNCYVFEQSVFDRYFGVGATAAIRSGTAQAGAAGTITLDAGASTVDDFYNDTVVEIMSGLGAGQVRRISDYVGLTRVASVSPNWITAPDNTSVFAILAQVEAAAGGGGTDWTADERTALRTILGIPSAGTTPEVPIAGALKAMLDSDLAVSAQVVTNADGIAQTIFELAKVPKSDGAVGWNATARGQIQTECEDAIVVYHLDHLLATDYDPDAKPGVATALLNELVEGSGGVSRFTASALSQAPAGGGGGSGLVITGAGYLGDSENLFSSHFNFKFNTKFNGVLTTLIGSPTVSIYRFGETTPVLTGIVPTVNFGGNTGLHHVSLDIWGNNNLYQPGDYQAVLAAGTVGGIGAVGHVIASFSVNGRDYTTRSNLQASVSNILNYPISATVSGLFNHTPLGSTINLDVALNSLTQRLALDAPPTLIVFEGADDTAMPAVGGAMALRVGSTTMYRGVIQCNIGAGFSAGQWYSVYVRCLSSGRTYDIPLGGFRATQAEQVAGVPKVDVHYSNGVSADLAAQLTTIIDTVQADILFDTAVSPWNSVWKKRGTGTELFRKVVYDVTGVGVTSTSTIIGRIIQ